MNPPSVPVIEVSADPCIGAEATITGTAGDDVLVGTDGDDVIVGGDGNDTIEGGFGNDVLCGGAGDDHIVGNEGDDQISGGDGNDTIGGGMNDDVILGGPGDDIVEGKRGSDQLFGGDGADHLAGNEDNDTVLGGEGNDVLGGGMNDDVILGGPGDDIVEGKRGSDQLFGEDGADSIVGGQDADVVAGGAGDDTLGGGKDNDELFGQAGDDAIAGKAGADYLDGGDGTDALDGDGGTDICDDGETNVDCEVETNNGDPAPATCGGLEATIVGTSGDDAIVGTSGDDVIAGGDGNDTITGGDGNDVICGDTGNDAISGDAGIDLLMGGDGNDAIDGGDGIDTALGLAGNDVISGGAGDDDLDGGVGDDTVEGDAGFDRVGGGAGDDALAGGTDDDALDGGAGTDEADGEAGQDRCANAETLTSCEEDSTDVTGFDVVGDELATPPAGTVLDLVGPSPIDPLQVSLTTNGGIGEHDVLVTPARGLAASLGDLVVMPPYDISIPIAAPEVASVDLVLPYREDLLGSTPETDVRAVYFNHNEGAWDFLPNQVLDTEANTISVTTDHLSTYGVIRVESLLDLLTDSQIDLGALVAAQSTCAATAEGAYRAMVLADGPLSYWPMDDTGSVLTDAVGSNDGVIPAQGENVTSLVAGESGGALLLQSDAGLKATAPVPLSGAAPPSEFSFEVWVSGNTVGGTIMEVGEAFSADKFFDGDETHGFVRFTDGTVTSALDFEPSITEFGETLLHVVVTVDDFIVRVYVNGDLSDQELAAGRLPRWEANPEISVGPSFTFDFVDSALTYDEMAFYDRALASSEISDHYLTGVATTNNADTDGDGLTDCEEEHGMFVLGWLNDEVDGSIEVGPTSRFVITTDPTQPDTDGDGLTDGEEMGLSLNVSVIGSISPSEVDFLESIGITRTRLMSSNPWSIDTDFDGTSDAIEAANLELGFLPQITRPGPESAGIPPFTLLQPASAGPSPLVNPMSSNNENILGRDTRQIRYRDEALLFDSSWNCVQQCDELNTWASTHRSGCYFGPWGCDSDAEQIRDKIQELAAAQGVFDDNQDYDALTMALLANETCQEFGYEDCDDFVQPGTPSSLLVGTVAPAATPLADAMESWLKQHTGQQQLRRSPARQGLIIASLVALLQIVSPEPDADLEQILDTCEDLLANDPHATELLGELDLGLTGAQDGQGTFRVTTTCESMPKYVPAGDVRQAATHRVQAIANGHTFLLSYRSVTYVGGDRGFSRRWKDAIPPCPTKAPAEQCDEYPNYASGESGPEGVDNNLSTASLQVMPASDNSAEGGHYSAMVTGTLAGTQGALFLVIPVPSLPKTLRIPGTILIRSTTGSPQLPPNS
ncbi:MAG: LamG-like jellyroll fold domain-containing protein [Acidimicrobiales bacterium]